MIENEKIKLRATYLNGVAVGLTIAGALVPYLAVVAYSGHLTERVISGVPPTFVELASAIAACIAVAMALQGARALRRSAVAVIGQLDESSD